MLQKQYVSKNALAKMVELGDYQKPGIASFSFYYIDILFVITVYFLGACGALCKMFKDFSLCQPCDRRVQSACVCILKCWR